MLKQVDLFAFGRVLGQLEPCGCTTEPLGGLQYAFGYIDAQSSAGARLILEPGSFLFPDPEHPEAPRNEAGWVQAEKKADTLQAAFGRLGNDLVSGLGSTDYAQLSAQAGAVDPVVRWKMPRVLANLSEAGRKSAGNIDEYKVVEFGDGLQAVVSAVVDPQGLIKGTGFPETTDPASAATRTLAQVKDAQLSVLIVSGSRAFAESMAKEVDVDIILMGGPLIGADRGRTGGSYTRVGKSWLIEPGDRTQTLTHLRLQLDSKNPSAALAGEWTIVETEDKRRLQLEQLDKRLAEMKTDASADPKFVARTQADRDKLAALLNENGLPEEPAVATFTQVPVTCRGATDKATLDDLHSYTAWVSSENQSRFAGKSAPNPAKGEASYVGQEACAECHESAAKFWQGTRHAGAYETLQKANKEFDLTCVNCHVTGFREPGGSEVVELNSLADVQCEQCHGPGSLHAEDLSAESIKLDPTQSTCASCHTPEHSDTFEYSAYLRDILGEGHGEEARKRLGAGPTGHDLRQAGLAAAGGACPKM